MKLYLKGFKGAFPTCFFCWKRFTDLCFSKHRSEYRCKFQQLHVVIAALLMLIVCYNLNMYIKSKCPKDSLNTTYNADKYILINGTEVTMEYSSYTWFESMKHLFKNLGEKEAPTYPWNTPRCKLNMPSLGPITIKKTTLNIEWVEKKHSHVKLGGFYAPAHCRSPYRIAIFVPYRNLKENLSIFLYYIHRLMKIHMLEYRIFIVEQFGTEKFNRGILFNIAYLESQRFGTWDCLIFHDVDAIPEDDRILYTCSQSPFHFASAVEQFGYNNNGFQNILGLEGHDYAMSVFHCSLRYQEQFGCVTALTPAQFQAVNGYSNFYWSWGGEDDDMSARLKFSNLKISRYNNITIGRFATLSHKTAESGRVNTLFVLLCRQRFQIEGLKTTNYKLIALNERKLFTHILVDVNPHKLKLDDKNLLRQLLNVSERSDLMGYRYTFLMHKATKPTIKSPVHENIRNT